jgi:hypothetical protein
MGIRSVLEQQPDFPERVLGAAMNAYYGGRAEVRIRRGPVPVAYLDFASVYPTVNALMGLWGLLTAERIEAVDDTERVRELLASVTAERCFDPAFWRQLPALVLVRPRGDVLPVRARYAVGGTWGIGLNPLHSEQPMWYALPDLIASVLLTGRVPEVLRAGRLVPRGRQPGLRPVRLRGEVEVDPTPGDLFRALVEERRRVRGRDDLPGEERERLAALLKCLVNAGSLPHLRRDDPPGGEARAGRGAPCGRERLRRPRRGPGGAGRVRLPALRGGDGRGRPPHARAARALRDRPRRHLRLL